MIEPDQRRRTRKRRRMSGAQRDALVRAQLEPLGPGERPPALLAAIVLALALAGGVIAGGLTDPRLSSKGGSIPGAAFIALVLVSLAVGMWRRRYWAVLGFEAFLAFQVGVTALALVVAASVLGAVVCVASIAIGGALFWKLIRVMGRIQAAPGPENSL